MIAGSGLHGVDLTSSDENVIQGNRIGSDASGVSDPDSIPDSGDELGNGGDGIE